MTCTYCGSTRRIEQDHVIAKSKGGKRTVPACRKCNRLKSNMSVGEFATWVKKSRNNYLIGKMKKHHKYKSNSISQVFRTRLNK